MTFQILYKKSILEYIKKQDARIISILGFNLVNNDDLKGLLRNLELIAKRVKIKELWLPWEPSGEIFSVLNGLGYQKAILGYHERENKKLEGYKLILN